MGKLFNNKIILKILEKYKSIWSIDHSLALFSWDGETFMPEDGVEERSIAVSQLALLEQKFIVDKNFIALVDKASEEKDLNEYERGVVRILHRSINLYTKVPPRIVEELAKISEEAKVVWRNARIKNNFNIYKPYLEKIVALSKEKAEFLGYEDKPYDALLNLYEEGLTCKDIDNVFEQSIPSTKIIVNKILSERIFPQNHPFEDIVYDLDSMKKVNNTVLSKLGYNNKRFRMDVSAHPFTIGVGIKDVRITTRYEGRDFKTTLFSAIHEYGHALYELQDNVKFVSTPIVSRFSLGIHESQSRFWENIIGRSKSFCEAVFPILKENLQFIKDYSSSDVYYYFNTVRPSLIRVDADEVTYNLHILLRYKLEKELISGEIKVSDLPELWNNIMEENLGIKPKTFSEGILQDIHWSQGNIGYFPTYTLGTIIAAQLRHYIIQEIPNFNDNISSMNFEPIKTWLREKIHIWGSTYMPKELLKKAIGEEINPRYFTDYLKEKYLRTS
jgi:carboxypeptidase Taq